MRCIAVFTAGGFVAASLFVFAPSAGAQEAPSSNRPMAAPSNALELGVGTGYTQGFGPLTPSQKIRDVAGAGVGVNADIAYRFDPRWSIGVQGEYQEFANNASINNAARGLAGNLGFVYHFMPRVDGDPWLHVGTGYRMLWSVNPTNGAPTTLVHGFELAKATVGYDFRISPSVAVAPFAGADLDLWAWQQQSGTNTALSSAQVGTYIFAGLQGRFDMGQFEQRRYIADR